jgi:hypothetical protein
VATQESSGSSGSDAPKSGPIDVFTSYSHEDEALHVELAKHLKPLEREGIIHLWHDRRITAGKEFAREIDDSLNRAGMILLLVSPDFIASEYCWGNEMKRAMERHEAGEARVIPIILRPVDWHQTPFGKLLALPKDGKPVTSWDNQDAALLDIAGGIRTAAADLGVAAQSSPALTLEIRGVAYTTEYRGVIIQVDIGNRDTDAHQITRCSLEIPSLGMTLEHVPGPQHLIGGPPWLPRAPISLEPRKPTRGSLFFPAGMGPLRDGLPEEPLPAKLRVDFFLEPAIEREVEICTFETLEKMERSAGTRPADEPKPGTGTRAPSPAEKLRVAAERREQEMAKKQEEQRRRENFERAAFDAAPKEFEALAETLRQRGEALNEEHLPGVPVLKFEPVNHRLDAGSTYSIELSPYAQLRSFTARLFVGLHPSAHQSHAELPIIETTSRQFRAHADEQGFSWVDEHGMKWTPERIVDFALDKFTDLLSAEPDYSGGLDEDGF